MSNWEHVKNPYFDNCPDRRNLSESNKWRKYPEEILPMWVADMDCICPDGVRDALIARASNHNVFGYGRARPELYELIMERYASLYGWKIEKDAIRFTAGVVLGFNQVLDAQANPGDGILFQTPAYPPILETPDYRKLPAHPAPMTRKADGTYEVDFDRFEAAIQPNTRYFLFCNPQNPTGRVFTREEVEKFAEICLRHKLTILADEIHQDMVYSGHKHTPIASLSKEVENITATFSAPSKTYNIAGLKCSYAVIPNPELRAAFDAGGPGLIDSVSVLGLVAADAAYRTGDAWLKDTLAYLEDNRDWLWREINQIDGISMGKPDGTFLAWLDCSGLKLNETPYEFFLKNTNIAFNDGRTFGQENANFVRMNFGCSFETLQQAVSRMKQAVAAR